ncbi:FtsX-like permease family protein [Massilia sp. Dwa41.01b]|uniref:ABC transporter permease n=1 Tax=unclassified Massilia TaxID=2609279 RepID=UPI0016042DDF|nr:MULTISPECIES: ABC transporter permease [unclassified Massilia]QNA89642.1 FtsX-like permease family protein [Massilia sp. Dwa41.01b]QNB00543.1 FtsX-like permease family protein [Massilia sp. Se16.2.3]
MFRHLLKLTWKRKSRNLMLSLEILLAFAIVFAVAACAVRYAQLYAMPLGFDGTDVWSVNIQAGDDGQKRFDDSTYDSLRRGLAELPEVRAVAFMSFEPYSRSTMTSDLRRANGKSVDTDLLEADDTLPATLGLHVVEGRWFSALDNGSADRPAVINRRMADAMFAGERAVGQRFSDGESAKDSISYRVVGVVDAYRPKGELSAPVNLAFLRLAPGKNGRDARTILLKVKPGTERSFEASLNRRLKLIRNDWSFQISPLSSSRAGMLKSQTTPLVVVAVIAAFMLLMVAFGLFGALWQNTTQRIPEIGLRRAVGASAASIYRQIVAEQFLLSSIAIAAGLALLVQLPVTGVLGESLNWTVFTTAALLSMALIYLISLLCAVYPGWRASRLSPTEALHYE